LPTTRPAQPEQSDRATLTPGIATQRRGQAPTDCPETCSRPPHAVSIDPSARPCVLYLSGQLPARSETFVYREVFGLRDAGLPVHVASVYAPDRDLGDPRLDALADEAIPIYGSGKQRLLADALSEWASHPIRSLQTWTRVKLDGLFDSDVRLERRPRVLWQGLAALALAHRVRALGITHVHAHMAHVPTTIAMYMAKQLGVPFSFTGHAVDLLRLRTLLKKKLERAAFVSCISHWHRGFYQGIAALPDQRLPIVRCGVDVDQFMPREREFAGGPLELLGVGRLVEKKGFDVLIEALARVQEYVPVWRCRIVGDGPKREQFQSLIARHHLQDRIELLGARSNDEIRHLMSEADLFVLPCKLDPTGDRDGIPVVLMEAMASGVCAISGDLPAIRELVDLDKTGVMVEPGSIDALTKALRSLLTDADRRRQLAAAGRERVVEEFSLDVNVERLRHAFGRARVTA
jgi:glycosyltransferase involved in cell wall biosynthesis